MEEIKISNLTKKYKDLVAVNNLCLEIKKGEIVGFVGKNGAGKSTTLRVMLDIIKPTTGKISILGLDSIKDSKKIKEKVSYIPSEAVFYDNLKVVDLLNFSKSISKSNKDINELVKYFELDLTKKIEELSLGNKKKVSLVQGLLKDSDIIILDEPTNGLDPLMQKKFFEYIIKEKNKGKTIFLSSHNLNEVEEYCDKVAIIKNGLLIDYINMKDMKDNYKLQISYNTKDGKNNDYIINNTSINNEIKKLSKLEVINLEIKKRTISDEFISYYEEGEDE